MYIQGVPTKKILKTYFPDLGRDVENIVKTHIYTGKHGTKSRDGAEHELSMSAHVPSLS